MLITIWHDLSRDAGLGVNASLVSSNHPRGYSNVTTPGQPPAGAGAGVIAEVDDPDCPFVGPFLKNRHAADLGLADFDSAPEIEDMLAKFGVTVDEEGVAS